MNNEPVALMTEYGIKPLYEGALQEGMFLYTHPADHEKTFNEMVELYEKQLDKKADCIAELEKELKRTKFAWNLAENEIETLKYEKSSGVYDLAKTLTPLTEDECRAIIEKHNWFAKSWAEMAMEIQDAILRKAQEK